ncbi:MAG: peptidoglycan DD-metalloendopeptidase family protein, partial [Anaerolineales bacterium]|nr:peptidoglycan DD-metalloendopeptidase family protein [Anaerolineales bacterium]
LSLGIGLVYGVKAAGETLLEKRLDIDILMVVGALMAAGVGHAEEGALLLVLFTFAGALEELAMERTRREIRSLQAIMPDRALALRDGEWAEVRPEELRKGEEIRVRPGDRVPVDAVVLEGESSVDEATLTGESVPRSVARGDDIFAGTINGEAVLRARVKRLASESSVQRVLALVDDIVGAEAANQGASFVWLEDAGINEWQFAPRTLIHPLALAVLENTLYLLDSGRVLALDLDTPAPPRILLAPGDQVENTRVLEPLDLAAAGPDVLVLDRAGDVYRYDRRAVAWHLERSDRHNEAELSDYFVALAANADTRFLLESNYEYIRRYQADGFDAAWLIPDNHDVDLDAAGEAVYLLSQEKDDIAGRLLRYQLAGADVSLSRAFRPAVTLLRPRQVAATATTVYVLDEGGRRLLSLDPAQGQLQTVWQRRDARPMTALWADAAGGRLIVAGRDRLWFYGMPAETTNIQPGATVTETLHDAGFLAQMNGWLIPIGGSDLPARDLQMPGAPRHYRLGIHEGVDFYWQPGTLVRAAASGRVIRAMTDYVPAGYAELTAWRAETLQLGYTSAAALDGYRGQQVWIEHENGLVTRYAHLSQIAPGIEMGVTVTRGQVIGAVGNSGSPASLISPEEDAHLHFEVWLGDQYLGQFLRPVEIREWLRTIFMAQ